MANSIDVNPIQTLACPSKWVPPPHSRTGIPLGKHQLFAFLQAKLWFRAGTLLCEKDGLWLPDQVCLDVCYHFFPHHRTWVFFSVIPGKCSPSFGFQNNLVDRKGSIRLSRLIWFGTLGSLPLTLLTECLIPYLVHCRLTVNMSTL